jgi:hypothetical protein
VEGPPKGEGYSRDGEEIKIAATAVSRCDTVTAMAFVKLDCGMLNSTIWYDREARELFITALLMATPKEFAEPTPEIAVGSLEHTGWIVPPGWYGFVEAAGVGIIRRAGLEMECGEAALARLAAPEGDSRTPDFEGRRMVRVDGGYVVLNFMRYRDRDHTAAARQRRLRARRKDHGVTALRNGVTKRNITQAEAEAEADTKKKGREDGSATRPPRASALMKKRFEKPSVAEVEAFADEKGLDIDPVKFVAYYDSNGWRVGRNPMRNWKAAMFNWARRDA